jgi:predicted enzyme related to lactoylglutathione lyase
MRIDQKIGFQGSVLNAFGCQTQKVGGALLALFRSGFSMLKELNVIYYVIDKNKWVEAKEFYEKVLGLTQSFGSDEIGWIEYKIDDTHTTALAISLAQVGQQVIHEGGGTAVFLVGNIHSAIAKLKKHSVKFLGDLYEDEMLKLAKFEDPCGNRLQIVQVLAQSVENE